LSFGEFGNIWRKEHKSNDDWDYKFEERGSGLGDSYNNLEIKWLMNKEFIQYFCHPERSEGSRLRELKFFVSLRMTKR